MFQGNDFKSMIDLKYIENQSTDVQAYLFCIVQFHKIAL